MGSAIVEMEQLLDRGQGGETHIDLGRCYCVFFCDSVYPRIDSRKVLRVWVLIGACEAECWHESLRKKEKLYMYV